MSEANLETALLEALRKELPTATAVHLQKFIEEAKRDKEELVRTKAALSEALRHADKILMEQRERELITAREIAVTKKEQEQALKEEVLKIREQHANERVSEIRNLTSTVFQSNRMNYNLALSVPMPDSVDHYGNTRYAPDKTLTGTLEKDKG